MTWTVGRQNPLLIAPYPNIHYPRFTGSLGGIVDNWHGSGAPSIVTGEGATGTYCLRFPAAGATLYADQYSSLSGIYKTYTKENAAGPMYVYFRAKAKSCTPNAWFELYFQYATAALAPTGSSIYDYYPIGSSTTVGTSGMVIPTDNTWRLYRSFSAIPDMPSNAAYYYILFGRLGAAETFDVYIDDIQVGHALDFQDLGGASYGAMALHPFDYKKIVPRSMRQNAYGRHASRRMNTGKYSGVLRSTTFTQGENAYYQSPGIYHSFIDYLADGTTFTLAYDQTETTRDYFSKCVLNQEDDGLEYVNSINRWRGTINWRESA